MREGLILLFSFATKFIKRAERFVQKNDLRQFNCMLNICILQVKTFPQGVENFV